MPVRLQLENVNKIPTKVYTTFSVTKLILFRDETK